MDKLLETARVFIMQNPDRTSSIIGNWFTYTNLTLSTAVFGFTFLIACIATAAYYVLVAVTDPSQNHRRSISSLNIDLGNYLTISPDWNYDRILKFIHFAYSTYSTLDLDKRECQNKIICEFQENDANSIVGKVTRRISKFLLFFNIFNKVPYIKEYQEAVRIGQRRSSLANETLHQRSCEDFYPACQFSIEGFNEQYASVFNNY